MLMVNLPKELQPKILFYTLFQNYRPVEEQDILLNMPDLAIRSLSMEGRMTVCNMSIESGARGGLIAPDETTFRYIKGREFAPKGEDFEKAVEKWKKLKTDEDAVFDKELTYDAADIEPMITYGTNPGMGIKISGNIPAENEIEEKSAASFQKIIELYGI